MCKQTASVLTLTSVKLFLGPKVNSLTTWLIQGLKSWISLAFGFSAFLALIGSNGRIVADEYCIAAELVTPGRNLFELGFSHSAPVTNILQVTAVQMVLTFGQSATFAIGLILLFLSLTFAVNQFLRFRSEIARTQRLRISLYLSFASMLTLISPAGLPLPSIVEASTQQAFVAQVLLRYSGFSYSMAGLLLLVGIAVTLLENSRSGSLYLRTVGIFMTSLLAGASHQIFAAVYVLLILLYSLKSRAGEKKKPTFQFDKKIVIVLAGSLTGFALILNSGPSTARLSSMASEKLHFSEVGLYLNNSLDMIWWLASPVTFPFVGSIIIGALLAIFCVELKKCTIDLKWPAVYAGLFLSIFSTIFLFVGIVSYSAPWHLILPRLVLQFLGLALGIALGRKFNGRNPGNMSKSVLGVAIVIPMILSLSWATTIPSRWTAASLPLQTVFTGLGSGVSWEDTGGDGTAGGCYPKIRDYLLERKSYLEP